MNEEKKEIKEETPKAETPKQETPKPEAPKTEAPKTEAPKPEAAKQEMQPQAQGAAQAQKPEEKKVKGEAANCAACKKSLKKKRYYYRNGKYFCTKRCWATAAKKEKKPDEAKPA